MHDASEVERKEQNLLEGRRVFLVPIGADISRKRLEIFRKNIERLGGTVLCSQTNELSREELSVLPKAAASSLTHKPRKRFKVSRTKRKEIKRMRQRSTGTSPMRKTIWEVIDTAVVSSRIDIEHLLAVYKLQSLPAGIASYTPEWITFMIKVKRHPNTAEIEKHHLIWPTKQDTQSDAKEVDSMQAVDAPQVFSKSSTESDNESISLELPEPDRPELHLQMQKLQMEKSQLVRKHAKIFYKNNPKFKAISSFTSDTKTNTSANFVCQRTSLTHQNLNSHLTGPLEELIEFLHIEKDQWRVNSYKKVVGSLKVMQVRLSTVKDIQGLWWAKGRMYSRVAELLETGRMEKLEAKRRNPRLQTMLSFARIWGVGPTTAIKLYDLGFRTLADLEEAGSSVLSQQQRIGLRHYDDFLKKIPREEVKQIESIVVDEVHQILPRANAMACGSYRRGKEISGDCDILITDPDEEECGLLPELLVRLRHKNFITDDLTQVSDHHMGRCDSYMGVCRVNEHLPHRRLDIKVYPRRFYPFALLYFTGSDHFNRSMRLYAKKRGYSLSDRFLKPVMRASGHQIDIGDFVKCTNEAEIFIALGLEYKDPLERNCFDVCFLKENEGSAKGIGKRC
uniref:DNA polymerase n=1 Tax=Albugo laibachii Nc14 TaxID=890382 RepID=F0WG97_9STRA|nr:DNA polymerase lambdalike protein putative [Albugo laibachii Nc14]|eukprot:CCA20232.1 DNA polymerase lambdalike protein putative [Albugo laibachii Nc14]